MDKGTEFLLWLNPNRCQQGFRHEAPATHPVADGQDRDHRAGAILSRDNPNRGEEAVSDIRMHRSIFGSLPAQKGGLFTALALMVVALGLLSPSAARAVVYSAIVIDAETGQVLHQDNPDAETYPASLTKMMTLYMLFDAVDGKKVKMGDRMPVSAYAAGQAPSKLGLRKGQTIRVEDAIKALVTKSANDVAVVVAEYLGDNEPNFGQMMTRKARALGMSKTQFRNASGLPNPNQTTTARDIAKLSVALRRDFPQYYHYFAVRSFKYGKQTIATHNRVLLNYKGADGLKTGYIRDSGFNLATSARRDGRSVVGVVLGGQTASWRDKRMMSLLDTSFAVARNSKAPTPVYASAPAAPKLSPAEQRRQAQLAAKRDAAEQQLAAALARSDKKATLQARADVERTLSSMAATAAAPATQWGRVQSNDGSIEWAIQVGAFSAFSSAHTQATKAMKVVQAKMASAQLLVTPMNSSNGLVYRARLVGLDGEDQAKAACKLLKQKKMNCLPVPPADVNIAMVQDSRKTR